VENLAPKVIRSPDRLDRSESAIPTELSRSISRSKSRNFKSHMLYEYSYVTATRWGTLPAAQLVEAPRYKPEGRGLHYQ